ncbi:MAG: cupin domain-containing protein [Chitinophagaceae bacterium]|nr:cupin domain-containing protein [Chitinophagaceae bacterium]
MSNIKKYIESGILESYLLGITNPVETNEVEQMASTYAEIKSELDKISTSLETYAHTHAIAPNPVIKPFLMAIIDYSERMQKGEPATFPPILDAGSSIDDYTNWLNRADMQPPGDFKEMFAKIIGYTPGAITAIAWIKHMAPEEVHDNEYEKFLIIEGTCNIIVDEKVHSLTPGDYFPIPLYKNHHVQVTSAIPCKVILQRIAA